MALYAICKFQKPICDYSLNIDVDLRRIGLSGGGAYFMITVGFSNPRAKQNVWISWPREEIVDPESHLTEFSVIIFSYFFFFKVIVPLHVFNFRPSSRFTIRRFQIDCSESSANLRKLRLIFWSVLCTGGNARRRRLRVCRRSWEKKSGQPR